MPKKEKESEEKHSVEVYLTSQQYKKFEEKKLFQLSFAQLAHPDGHHRDHHCELHLTPAAHKKLLRNVKNEKGFRFNP
jgi:hypothetical protein